MKPNEYDKQVQVVNDDISGELLIKWICVCLLLVGSYIVYINWGVLTTTWKANGHLLSQTGYQLPPFRLIWLGLVRPNLWSAIGALFAIIGGVGLIKS